MGDTVAHVSKAPQDEDQPARKGFANDPGPSREAALESAASRIGQVLFRDGVTTEASLDRRGSGGGGDEVDTPMGHHRDAKNPKNSKKGSGKNRGGANKKGKKSSKNKRDVSNHSPAEDVVSTDGGDASTEGETSCNGRNDLSDTTSLSNGHPSSSHSTHPELSNSQQIEDGGASNTRYDTALGISTEDTTEDSTTNHLDISSQYKSGEAITTRDIAEIEMNISSEASRPTRNNRQDLDISPRNKAGKSASNHTQDLDIAPENQDGKPGTDQDSSLDNKSGKNPSKDRPELSSEIKTGKTSTSDRSELDTISSENESGNPTNTTPHPELNISPDTDTTDATSPASEMSTESGFGEGFVSPDTAGHETLTSLRDSTVPGGAPTGVPGASGVLSLRSTTTTTTTSTSSKSRYRVSSESGLPPTPLRSTMEEEVEFLREELRSQTSCVQRLQTSLYDQQVRANVATVALRSQLRKKERRMQQLRQEHEDRMSALLTHLLFLEGQMRHEQRHVLELLHDKDDVIRRQKSAIEDLASKNARLLTALKEVHGYSGGNGITPTTPGEGYKSGKGVVLPPPVVLRNKDKGQKVRFSSVKDKLRRHKSSLELHRPASLDTLMEGALRYGSQENLAATPTSRISGDGLCSDELKKTRQQERKERCKSLIDFPFRLNDLPEVSSEVERGRADSPIPDGSVSASPCPSVSSHNLSSPHQRDSLYSDEDEAFHSGQEGGKVYGELAKAASMPQSLASPVSDLDLAHAKERPHSLSGAELSMERMTMMPMEKVSMMPSPTSLVPPGGSESNPFKSFKNVFKRRNSKQRSKKRPASLGPQTTEEHHEALKEHFKKYDLS